MKWTFTYTNFPLPYCCFCHLKLSTEQIVIYTLLQPLHGTPTLKDAYHFWRACYRLGKLNLQKFVSEVDHAVLMCMFGAVAHQLSLKCRFYPKRNISNSIAIVWYVKHIHQEISQLWDKLMDGKHNPNLRVLFLQTWERLVKLMEEIFRWNSKKDWSHVLSVFLCFSFCETAHTLHVGTAR